MLPEHQSSLLVLSQAQEEMEVDEFNMDDEDEDDRLFTFEVAKTLEQEEGVKTSPGFKVIYSLYRK